MIPTSSFVLAGIALVIICMYTYSYAYTKGYRKGLWDHKDNMEKAKQFIKELFENKKGGNKNGKV